MLESVIKKNELTETLAMLCRKNGRCLEILPNRRILTFDIYEGTDAHYSDTVEEAIEWEKGYLPSPCPSELLPEQ